MDLLKPDLLFSLSLLAFLLHISGYVVYATFTLQAKIKPNAASWLMWMFGGVIEFLTYSAIDGETWFGSSLPLACVIGLALIFFTTLFAEYRSRLKKVPGHVFHKPEPVDYGLISFDAFAGLIWLTFNTPFLANTLAVSSSIVTFIPIWKTTLQTGEERVLPWCLWCLAYTAMLLVVLLEGGANILKQLIYPIYYLLLHGIVLLLCIPAFRLKICAWINSRSIETTHE